MPRLLERFAKLRGKSIDELRVRCAQAARARLERLGLSRDIREPTDDAFALRLATRRFRDGDALLQGFRRQALASGRFLPGLGSPEDTAREFARRFPRGVAATISAADRILDGRVDLGGRIVSVGVSPDWTLEPVSGKRAPAIHWSRIAYLDPLVAGDCKLTWELNRHQYFVTLGRAYLLTQDDRYASLITEHLSSWMDENPPKIGINWTSSLELAFRAISWIWALSLIRNSSRLEPRLFVRALKYLYLHARHIERNLSTYFSPNTHLTGEALGLLYIGTAFPELEGAQYWRSLGHRVLAEQLERQLFDDGAYFEQSTYYHRYTSDFYLHALLLTRSSDRHLDSGIVSKLNALLDYLVHITRPDGTAPFIGDDDGGRLIVLGDRAGNDFRDTLALAATLLQRGDCAYVAGDALDELLWLLGPSAIDVYERVKPVPPACSSRAFGDSGYFVMRERWSADADWAVLRCGPHGRQTGAHAHADALALELSAAGHPTLIDPGTYTYTASRVERDYFRGSAAHNTVTVDGLSSAEPATSAFRWKSVPRSRATAWVSKEAFDFFEGEHDGYLRLDAPAVHSRATFFLKGEYWVIRDRILSDGKHHLAIHFHWAPEIILRSEGDRLEAFDRGEVPLVSARIFARSGQLSCHDGWVSSTYGTRTVAPVSVLDMDSDGSEEIVTVIARPTAHVLLEDCAWCAGTPREPGVLTIATASTSDTILTGRATNAEHPRHGIISDGRWTWLRRSLSGELLAFALVQGRNLVIDGRPAFRSESPVDCAFGQREPGGWSVDVQSSNPAVAMSASSQVYRIDEPCAASVE